MNYDRCDKCVNARFIVSENGIHPICCLSQKKAVDCLMGKINHYAPWKGESDEFPRST